MTERIDHLAEALRHAERADDLAQYMPDAMQAMIHATLALVEQQRITNLIGYAADVDVIRDGNHDDQIREALGLS